MNIEEFKRRKKAFAAKHGDELIMACEVKRRIMVEELGPLAKFSRMPAEKLLALLAKARVEGHL